jgi:hypothetical protein
LRTYAQRSVDLVKMDTETTEPDVLTGMGAFLSQSRPDIICEVLPLANVEALSDTLEPLGYAFYLLTNAGAEARELIVPDAQWRNYYFTARRAMHSDLLRRSPVCRRLGGEDRE